MFAASTRAEIEMWGVDHSGSAIARARARFPAHAERFLEADLADLERLDLPAFAVVLLLNVLQCTSVDRDRLLRDLKPLLTPDCRALVSIPNCHFGAHDILRRPLRRDDPRHDRSLVHKDLRYLTRELYRSGFQTVESFGTYDSFLLARR
jgi:SAM-dependent methyltransferase